MTEQEVSLIVNTILHTVPPLMLRLIPYRKKLRFKPWQVILSLVIVLGVQLLLLILYLRYAQTDISKLQAKRLIIGALIVPVPFIVIRENFFKLSFVWFIVLSYTYLLARFTTFLEIRFLSGRTIELYFGENNIILTCMVVVIWPLVLLFLCKAIVPALNAANSSVTRFMWLVPGLYLLNYIIYITDLRVEQISNARYMLLSIPLIAGIAISSYTLLRLLRQAAEKARLDARLTTIERQMEMQKEQYAQMAVNEKNVKTACHDLRHHLAVIKSMIENGETPNALAYCDHVAGGIIAVERRVYCQNAIVNAVVAHYLAVAERSRVDVAVQLDIPLDTGRVPASEICLAIGNLLENAVHACLRIQESNRFLKLNSRILYGKLYITLDNSFDGVFLMRDGIYLSSKREGAGLGLSSIESVCNKYAGSAKFEGDGSVFRSSVILTLERA